MVYIHKNPKSKYDPTNFSSIEDFKESVMIDSNLTDMDKLSLVFNVSKDNIKTFDPQLYYAILGVLDSVKIPSPMEGSEYFNGEN